MIRYISIKNQKTIMEFVCTLNLKLWILLIKCFDIFLCYLCTWKSKDFYFHSIFLFRKNVERVDVHISIDKNNVLFSLANYICKELPV